METDGDRKVLLNVNWDKGERAWKLWVTPVLGDDKLRVSFKILTKRRPRRAFRKESYDLVYAAEMGDGTKHVIFEGWEVAEKEIESFMQGVQATLYFSFGDKAEFELQDFSDCDTFEQFAQKMMEKTGNEVTDAP